jgi:glycosyltransferase involved in cell wall biosynthesis
VLLARLLGIPLVHTRHGQAKERAGPGRLIFGLDRLCANACTGIACHGPFLVQQVRALGVQASRIFEFDVDLREFVTRSTLTKQSVQMQEFARGFRFVLLYIGRIQRDKGVLDLLDAFSELTESGSTEIGLVYAGNGKDMEQLNRRVVENGIGRKVLLLGHVAHDHLSGVLRYATVVATPTRAELGEGRCMVALESLAMGVPVVAPDLGAFPYVVEHQVNGLLFEPGNTAELRQSISRLAEDHALLTRLKAGAETSAAALLRAQTTFAEAVSLAFGDATKRTAGRSATTIKEGRL